MAKVITANKLKRFWQLGVVAKMVGKARVLSSMEEIEANTNAENVAGATAVAELSNNLGGYSFGETADGKPGYRKPGADSVPPFSGIATLKIIKSAEVQGYRTQIDVPEGTTNCIVCCSVISPLSPSLGVKLEGTAQYSLLTNLFPYRNVGNFNQNMLMNVYKVDMTNKTTLSVEAININDSTHVSSMCVALLA